ncbi:MAG: 2-deoxy-scyllo-inosose synthase [Clostridia bacterium]|nr:2-deoxy-scyllo-inosose synthase [Clostridia bacterium]
MHVTEKLPDGVKCLPLNLAHKVDLLYGIDIVDKFTYFLNMLSFDKVFFISEETIYNLHGRRLFELLREDDINCEVILIPGKEKNKSFENLEFLCNLLVEKNISKDSIIIAFGGGLIGNIVGMAAALIYRGIRFIEVSTTLMGQSDSTLSNKQAINGRTGKNQFGTYYSPEFVWADIKYLESESPRHIKAALVEGIKNAFISNADLLIEFERLLSKKLITQDELLEIYEIIIKSKNAILEKDPSERYYAIILEYGHTFGHAIEFLTDGRIIHGEAVAIGMCIAAELGCLLGTTSCQVLETHYRFFKDIMEIDMKLPQELSAQKIFEAIQKDNKRVYSGIKYILLDGIGKCMNPDGDYQVYVQPEMVLEAVNRFIKRTVCEI